MFLTVLGLLYLSSFGVASELLFHVDIALPREKGRKEDDDIEFIKSTLAKLTGINVIFARKTFGNRNVLLVVDVQEICQWSTLTSDLSEQGYELTVSPLQNCSDTALEFGVNVNYHRLSDIQAADILEFFVLQIYDQGMSTDEYVAAVKAHFERDSIILNEGCKSVCFRKYGELPVTLLYMGPPPTPTNLSHIYKEARNEGKASIEMDMLQSFNVYSEKC